MEHGQDHDLLGLNDVENGVWKAARADAPDLLVFDRIPVGVLGRKVDCTVNLRYELNSQTGFPVLLPQGCAVKFGPRGWPKDDLEGHPFRRAAMDALMTSQGTTSSGLFS